MRIALQQVSSRFARRNAQKTLHKPVALRHLTPHIGPNRIQELEKLFPDGKVWLWGAKYERGHQLQKMKLRGCLFLFRRAAQVYLVGVVKHTLVAPELAEKLWRLDTDKEPWGLVFFFDRPREVAIPASAVNGLVGRAAVNHWQGLVAIDSPGAERVVALVRDHLRPAGATRAG